MFPIRPAPKSGVGMRKIMLFSARASSKLGCGSIVHVDASDRPTTVNRSSTPPLGAFRFRSPDLLKKNGKRASRTGPLGVMKDGIVFVELLTTGMPFTRVVN